jgi:hypothetical protein
VHEIAPLHAAMAAGVTDRLSSVDELIEAAIGDEHLARVS